MGLIKAHFHANDVVFSISVCLTVCLSVSRMSYIKFDK